jgi:chemotaxis protein CheZ
MCAQHAPADRPYSREEVVLILQSVMHSTGGETESARKIQTELKVLHDYIEGMRSELAQMRSIEISHTHIPSATDELDAVVEETAKATSAIMDACEQIDNAAREIGGDKAPAISTAVTAIYEACSFQDITGQRINKVVKALKKIEGKVEDILSAFGHAIPEGPAERIKAEADDPLLEGPQLNGPAVDQSEIDRLLAEFDTK